MGPVSLARKSVQPSPEPQSPGAPPMEWLPHKRWNPFNSNKLLAHVYRWRLICRGRPLPPPVLITVDPTNVCNFDCVWCNAAYIRQHRQSSLSVAALRRLADFLPRWGEGNPNFPPGVEAICVAGGGEPLLNPHTPEFIDRVTAAGLQVGLVTNGTKLIDAVDALSQCTWIGVSVDAGTTATFNRLKGLPTGSSALSRIAENIAILMDYARKHHQPLGCSHPSYGVSYKYLLYDRDNIGEMYQAAKLAKQIGCKNIHFRPAGTPWDKIGTPEEITFTSEDIELFQEQIARVLELDDETFSVYGVTHKFSSQFTRANYFQQCHAIFMTGVVEPPNGPDHHEDWQRLLHLLTERRTYVQRLLSRCRLLAPSRFLRNLHYRCGVAPGGIIHLPLGLDDIGPALDADPAGPPRLVFLGNIIPVKRLDLAIKALIHLEGQASLEIWGGCPQAQQKALQQRLAPLPHINYQGPYQRPDLPRILAGAAALVICSDFENYPLVVRESLMLGVPVIASRAGGLPEIVHDGRNGLLFPPGDAEALRRTVLRLLRRPNLQERLRRGIAPVKTMAQEAREMLEVYTSWIVQTSR